MLTLDQGQRWRVAAGDFQWQTGLALKGADREQCLWNLIAKQLSQQARFAGGKLTDEPGGEDSVLHRGSVHHACAEGQQVLLYRQRTGEANVSRHCIGSHGIHTQKGSESTPIN
ncbi:hypothetical protein [Pseudomonas fluorescens group sp. PF-69]